MGESFWKNNNLVTNILFELQPIIIFSLVTNFGNQSIFVDLTEISFIPTMLSLNLSTEQINY